VLVHGHEATVPVLTALQEKSLLHALVHAFVAEQGSI
jgi:hypothetical protein